MNRADEVLGYLSSNIQGIASYEGWAFAESQILYRLRYGIPSSPAGLIGDVYYEALLDKVPPVANRQDIYGFTHAIFFATDFGRYKRPLVGYGEVIDGLLPQYHNDPDPLCELVMCAKMIGHDSMIVQEAESVYWDAFNTMSRDSSEFNENYHKILVGGILDTL